MKKGRNIYHRKDGRWEGRYRRIDNTVGYVYGRTFSECKEKLENANKDIPKGDSNISFSAVAEEWLIKKQGKIKKSSEEKYRSVIENRLQPRIKQSLSKITELHLRQLIESLKAEYSAESVFDTVRILKSIFRYAGREYKIANMTVFADYVSDLLPVHRLKERKIDLEIVSEIEKVLIGKIENGDIKALALLLILYTGLRIGEMCALKNEDIDLENEKIEISSTVQRLSFAGKTKLTVTEPKTEKSKRTVPIPKHLKIYIQNAMRSDGFFLTQTELPGDPRRLQYALKKITASLGSSITVHDLRHSFATRCYKAGVEIKTVSEILGHSSTAVTMNIYTHSDFEDKAKGIDLVSRQFFRQQVS